MLFDELTDIETILIINFLLNLYYKIAYFGKIRIVRLIFSLDFYIKICYLLS